MLFMKSLKVTKLHCIIHGQVISTTIQNFSKKKGSISLSAALQCWVARKSPHVATHKFRKLRDKLKTKTSFNSLCVCKVYPWRFLYN